ncbi:MAG TPA: aminoglycoside phosphotransferase family protein [Candidatus Saccharimonadales bacterium]|nr:aminoglycoside phosphotransferase family protein [Candidatus Saccharimonadales bacterium]
MLEHSKNPTFLLNKIAMEFPDLPWGAYRYIDEGWDHEVIILDEKIVFRFPTDKEYTDMLKDEIKILKAISPNVSITIPKYTYISKNGDFAGYDIVPGESITKTYFDQLEPTERTSIIKQLADFLSTIHTLDVKKGDLKLVNPSFLPADQAEIRQQMPQLQKMLDGEDYIVVQKTLSEIDTLLQQSLPSTFIHNDIYDRHLFWDQHDQRVGLIDFSDMSMGDPAADFGQLYEYGIDFIHELYRYYTGPKDDTFLDRAWSYQKWTGVYMMTDYFENHKTSFEVARETFDRVKDNIPK